MAIWISDWMAGRVDLQDDRALLCRDWMTGYTYYWQVNDLTNALESMGLWYGDVPPESLESVDRDLEILEDMKDWGEYIVAKPRLEKLRQAIIERDTKH